MIPPEVSCMPQSRWSAFKATPEGPKSGRHFVVGRMPVQAPPPGQKQFRNRRRESPVFGSTERMLLGLAMGPNSWPTSPPS
jgi:hypothetical protein